MTASWTTAGFSGCATQLLFKTRFDRSGYHVQLTDLSRIWEEALSKQEIIKRAVETGCSFNPGDDDTNYQTFLTCIQSALKGEERTTSALRKSDPELLLLDLTVSLPGGLSALKWTIEFVQLPISAVANEIVGPLLLQANNMRSQIQQLVDEISARDHVIQKITDKFDTAAMDLTAVFPGASNIKASKKRSQSQRSQLAAYVKGLAAFDQVTWEASNEKLNEAQELTSDILNMVLRDLPVPAGMGDGKDSWVENLASRKLSFQGHSLLHSRPKNSAENMKATKSDAQDDDFQRQEKPPHLSKHSLPKKEGVAYGLIPQSSTSAQPGEDSETEDEDCLDISPTTSQQQAMSTIEQDDSLAKMQDQSPSRLSRTSELAFQSEGNNLQPAQPDLNEETDATTSPPSVSMTQVGSEVRDAESEVEPEVKPRKVGLGKFKGKTSQPKTVGSEEEEAEPESAKPKSTLGKFRAKKAQPSSFVTEPTTTTTSPSKPKGTLGRFGGKGKIASASFSARQDEPDGEPNFSARQSSPSPIATPSRRQVSEQISEIEMTVEEKQQRADEKREKLKRELDAKAKVPAKKRRKF